MSFIENFLFESLFGRHDWESYQLAEIRKQKGIYCLSSYVNFIYLSVTVSEKLMHSVKSMGFGGRNCLSQIERKKSDERSYRVFLPPMLLVLLAPKV